MATDAAVVSNRIREALSTWNLGLGAAVVAAAVAWAPTPEVRQWLVPAAGMLLLAVSAGWYWRQQVRAQPEAVPKLRVGGAALLVLLLCLVNALALASLFRGSALPALGQPLLVAATTASLTIALAVVVDLTSLRRRRWSWPLVAALALVLAGLLISDFGSAGFLVAAAILLGVTTPLEWSLTLGRTERRAFLALAPLTLVPLGLGTTASRLFQLPEPDLLVDFVELGSLVGTFYVAVLVLRAGLAQPGARVYERKAQELDAIHDFSLTTRSFYDRREFNSAVLQTVLQIVGPDVVAVVEPTSNGRCRCTLLRAGPQGNHKYEFQRRVDWAAVTRRFGDRRPLEIVDHGRAQVEELRGVWEPTEGSSVLVPILSREPDLRALLAIGRFVPHAFTRSDVHSIAGFANQVALAHEHARLMREVVESERRKRELEIARELQLNLLPAEPPALPGLEIANRSRPATEVGGDYFDYLQLGDRRLGLVVGDVAGHGMPAGLLMAMAKSAIHTQMRASVGMEQLMERLDEMLLDLSADNQFMTLVFAELDLDGGSLRYVNAGHHSPLHYRRATGRVERLDATGIPLGMLRRPQGSPVRRPLQPGDVLAFYSDGLAEAFNPREEQFGVDRLAALVGRLADRPAGEILDEVFAAVERFADGVQYHDDATLVVVRVAAEAPPPAD